MDYMSLKSTTDKCAYTVRVHLCICVCVKDRDGVSDRTLVVLKHFISFRTPRLTFSGSFTLQSGESKQPVPAVMADAGQVLSGSVFVSWTLRFHHQTRSAQRQLFHIVHLTP